MTSATLYPHEAGIKFLMSDGLRICGAGFVWCSGAWYSGWHSGMATDAALVAAVVLISAGLYLITTHGSINA